MDAHEDLDNLPRQRDPAGSPGTRETAEGPGPQAAGHIDKGMRLLWHQDGRGNPDRAPEVLAGQPGQTDRPRQRRSRRGTRFASRGRQP